MEELYIYDSNVELIKCNISKNVNKNTCNNAYEYGGAICIDGDGSLKIIDCSFLNNSATYGADIDNRISKTTIYGKKLTTYNKTPQYIDFENIDSNIKKSILEYNIPFVQLVNDINDNKDVFSQLIYNNLIDIVFDKKQDHFLKSHYNLKNGFLINDIYKDIVKNKYELIISKEKFSFNCTLEAFKSGKLKVPGEYINNIFLNCDQIRAELSPYDKKILEDPNRGHWDLWEENYQGDIEINLEKPFVSRNPKMDINKNGIVAIDFGTKSTVVVYQKDDETTYIKRIGAGDLEKDVDNKDYENPTILEFRNIENFLKDYNDKVGRPETKWEDITTSYTAFSRMLDGESNDFYSVFSDLKQWAGKGKKVKIKDKANRNYDLKEFKNIDLDSDLNPIEIYAYYIGIGINNMHGDGIFMDYILSFPVKYEKELCEKIRYSFEKGLKKSLPLSILESDCMDTFKVRIGASEPAAYAVCALQEYGFEPEGDEKIFYGIFDFGGGTTDFDFGIWKEPEKNGSYDFEIEHFYDNGDRYLGGENLLQLLAFEIFKDQGNQKTIKDNKITLILPPECKSYPGSETLLTESQESELNMRKLMEECRYFWEHNGESFVDKNNEALKYEGGILTIQLYNTSGELKQCELKIDEGKLKKVLINRIDKGVTNFFESWREAASKIESTDKFHIFLAGNSSKSDLVKKSFEKHIENIIVDSKNSEKSFDFSESFEMFPPLGTLEAKEKQNERGGAFEEEIVPPTGKTGVAYGLIRSRESGRIKVTKIKSNQIKYFVGNEKRRRFNMIMNRDVELNKWIELIPADRLEFEIFYTDIPEATTNQLSIKEVKRVRCSIDKIEQEKDIYIRAISSKEIEYTVALKNEIEIDNYKGKVYKKSLEE